jgi:hypothetical protein
MFDEIVLALVVALTQLDRAGSPGERLMKLRTTEPTVAAAIEEGRNGAPSFASLVDTVERSRAIVYVIRMHVLPHGMEGCVVPGSPDTPYLRVLLAIGLPRQRMIPVLAHELQHIREVLDAGVEHDQAAFDRLFQRIGSRQQGSTTGEQYETAAAQEVERRVAREMRDFHRTRRRSEVFGGKACACVVLHAGTELRCRGLAAAVQSPRSCLSASSQFRSAVAPDPASKSSNARSAIAVCAAI